MAGETLELQVIVDATQATQQIAGFERETKKILTAAELVDKKILGLEKDLHDLSEAMVRGGANAGAYARQMQSIERELDAISGKSSAAKISISGLSKAKQQLSGSARNLGQDLLTVSYAVDDMQYGLKGLLNNIPQVVTAIGGPGAAGLAGAISIAAVAGSVLYDQFKTDLPDAAKAGADAAKKHIEDLQTSISDADKELQGMLLGASNARIAAQRMAVESAAAETNRARAAFREQFGINPLDMKAMGNVASQAQGDRDIWIQRWNAQKNQMEEVRVSAKAVMQEYAKTTDAYQLAVDEQILLGKYEAIEKERLAQEAQDAAITAANKVTEAEQNASDDRIKNQKKEADAKFAIYVAGLEDEEKQLREAKKASDKRIEEQRKRDAKELADSFKDFDKQWKAAEKAEEKRTKIAEREAEKRKKIADKEREEQIDSLTSFATGAATAAGRFAAEAAMGQEDAFANLLNAAAQAAGGQIVLEGGKLVAGGIASLLIGNPAAPGQIAGGLGLVAAGTAIQTGGPAAVQSLLGMAGGGGAGASASASSASRDRGASPRSSRGGDGGGGPLVINVSYGVGGPLPEDTAREISRVMQTGNRRRGAA